MGTLRPCVYKGPAGIVPKGTASRTQIGPLTKSIPFGTVPRRFRVNGWNCGSTNLETWNLLLEWCGKFGRSGGNWPSKMQGFHCCRALIKENQPTA